MPDRIHQLRELYGVEFPEDLFEFWQWYTSQDSATVHTFHETLGMSPVGACDVLAGKFDNCELRYSVMLHWRFSADPPEFFTVLSGNTDGLHWGYWFDDPGRLPPVVAAWYARDAMELWTCGQTLFDAIHEWIENVEKGTRENIEYDPDYADDYRADLMALAALREMLPAPTGAHNRSPTDVTPEGMGVVIPVGGAGARDLLLRGKRLWFDHKLKAFDVLEEAYSRLGREPLAEVVRTHRAHPHLPKVDILEYRPGDYHSIHEALAEPEKVRSLEIGGAGLRELPDLSSLSELRTLLLWGNALRDLSTSLAACRHVEKINLFRNEFQRIPSVLFELPELREINLGNNRIGTVNGAFERLRNLREFHLVGNPTGEAEIAELRVKIPNVNVVF